MATLTALAVALVLAFVVSLASFLFAHTGNAELIIIDVCIMDTNTLRPLVRCAAGGQLREFAGARNAHVLALSFALERSDTALKLRASNDTDTHAQLSHVSIDWPDGQAATVSNGLLGHALPRAIAGLCRMCCPRGQHHWDCKSYQSV